MKVNPLLTAILSGPWLMEPSVANSLLPVLDSLLAGKEIAFSEEQPTSFFAAFGMSEGKPARFESFDEAPSGSVAVINLSGVMMRQDSCFYYGTETIAAVTKAAFEHPNIAAIVKVVASGGGSVDGTEAYANVYASSPKPKVTFVKGIMASAAAWVGLKADHVMLEGKTTMVGSIGTQIELRKYKNEGVESHLIRATESTDKNEVYQQAMAGNYEPLRTKLLDPLNSEFLASVRESRAGKINTEANPLTGEMYVGQAAIDMGLADSFGTLEDAINLALELASKNQISNLNSNSNTMFGKHKFAAIGVLAGLTAVTADQVTAANDELEDKGITAAALISAEDYSALKAKADQVEGLAAAKTALEQEKTSLTAQVSDLQAKVTAYGSQPGTMPTTPKAEGNELPEEKKVTLSEDPEADAYAALGQSFHAKN